MVNTNNLKKIRLELNKSQKEIALLLNVSRSSYSMWETNHDIIPIKRLILFCDTLHVSVDYALGLTDENNTNVTSYDKEISIKRLKEFRKENKITQVKLARELNTVHPVIVNYENGKNIIATPFLYEICFKYKISADYLLGRINEPKYLI